MKSLRKFLQIYWQERVPDIEVYGEQSERTRNLERPKLRFKDQGKTSMMGFSIDAETSDTQDYMGWRAAVFTGAKSFEDKRVQRAVEARQRRKYPAVDASTYFITVGAVKNRVNHAFVFLAESRCLSRWPFVRCRPSPTTKKKQNKTKKSHI